jgi:hypothetical protein
MWESLMREQFFFRYHMGMSRVEFRSYPIDERRWMIDRFLEQKEREDEEMKKAMKKKR